MKKIIAILSACTMILLSSYSVTASNETVGISGADYLSTMEINDYITEIISEDEDFAPYTNECNIDKSFYSYSSDFINVSLYFYYDNQQTAMEIYDETLENVLMDSEAIADEIVTDDYSVYTCLYEADDLCIVNLLSGNSIIVIGGPVDSAESFAYVMEYFGVPQTPLIGYGNAEDNNFKDINEPNIIEEGDPSWISPDFEDEGNLADFFGTDDKYAIIYTGSIPIIEVLTFTLKSKTGGFIDYPTPETAWNCITSMGTFFNLDPGEIIIENEDDRSFTVSGDTVRDLMNTFFKLSPDDIPPIPGDSEVMYLEDSDTYAMYWHYSGGAYGVEITNYRVEGDRCTLSALIYADGGDDYEEGGYVIVLEKNPDSRVGYSIVQFQCP